MSVLGEVHLHIDGARDIQIINAICEELEARYELSTKITEVTDFIAGPQRQIDNESYESHTPGNLQVEELNYFSTTVLKEGSEKEEILQIVLDRLKGTIGVVIEFERVTAKINSSGEVSRIKDIPFEATPFSPPSEKTKRYEIHFGVSQRSATKILTLEDLRTICSQQEIEFGGWFKFSSTNGNSEFRSNGFYDHLDQDIIAQQRQELDQRLEQLGYDTQVKATCEEVIGVWHTSNIRTLNSQNLARWEQEFPRLTEFWVVLSNFLGDRDNRVLAAMHKNLDRGVTYSYFLRSHADIKRLTGFINDLSRRINKPNVKEFIRAYLVHTGESATRDNDWEDLLAKGGLFIANPNKDNKSGYRIVLEQNQQPAGYEVGKSKLYRYIDDLLVVVKGDKLFGARIDLSLKEGSRRDVFSVRYQIHHIDDISHKYGTTPATIMRHYDDLVSLITSKHEGEIHLFHDTGYTIFFRRSQSAIRASLELQRKIQRRYSEALRYHSIGMDFGLITQYRRAFGLHWEGESISSCLELAKQATGCFYVGDTAKIMMEKNVSQKLIRSVLEHISDSRRSGWLLKWEDVKQ